MSRTHRATFAPDFIEAYVEAFDEFPQMVAAGGPVRPVWETSPPSWLRELATADPRDFGVLSLMEPFDDFRIGPECYFYGVNMAVRRKVLSDLGGFNPDSFGDQWLGDGESGLLNKMRAQSLPVGYVPNAVVFHHIPQRRMSSRYLAQRSANQGVADAFSRYQSDIPTTRLLLADLVRTATTYVALTCLVSLFHRGRLNPLSISRLSQKAYYRAQFEYTCSLLTNKRLRGLVSKTEWM